VKVKFIDSQIRKDFFNILKQTFIHYDQLAKYLKVNRNTILRYKTGENLMSLDTFNSLKKFVNLKNIKNKIEFLEDNWGWKLGGEITHKKHKWIFESGRKKIIETHKKTDNLILKVDTNSPELAEFIGVLTGDGFIGKYKRSRIVQITGNKIKDREYYQYYLIPLIKNLFNIEPHFYDRQTCIRLNIYSKVLFNTINKLFDFPIGKKGDLKISEKLLKTTNSKIAVIRGIFDTDGCIHISKRNYPMINITTTSVPLAKQIQEILVELGFSCSIYVDEIKKKRKKAAYRINIYGKEQILKWKNLIGSSNPNRIKKIATVAQIT